MRIDFTNKQQLLQEDYLRAFGSWTKWIMGRMFGDELEIKAKLKEEDSEDKPFVIRGKYKDVKSYAECIAAEKDYIIALAEYGEEHPHTVKVKAELDEKVNQFERLTGIEWPFK